MNEFMLILCGIFAGAVGALGLGGGGVLIIFLSVFLNVSQLCAQGTNLFFFLPIALVSIIIYSVNGMIDYRAVVFIAICGIIGVFAGTFAAKIIGGNLLRKIFGVFLLLLGVTELLKKEKQTEI